MLRSVSLALALLSVGAAPAAAATRYAEPNGDGPVGSCPQSDPCGIRPAITDPSVVDGDEVVLAPGTYDITPGPPITIGRAINVHGQAGQPRPVITVQPGTSAVMRLSNAGAVLSDVDLIRDSGLFLLAISSGLAERVSARSGGSYACQLLGGVLRDSTCTNTVAVAVLGGDPSNSGTYTGQLVNVTARATGSAGAYAIQATAAAGATTTLTARNVIADGEAVDTFAQSLGGGSSATLTMISSNFQTTTLSGAGASATDPGSGTNQTAPPLLANPASGDYHQLTGSPTIDAGTTDSLLGAFDFERQARVDGSAPDIGADEVQSAPETSITKAPRDRVKTRKRRAKVRYEFSASEPGATFACSLDGAGAAPCSSPFTARVRKGKHSFTVVATDPALNADQSAASDAFKVKRKKRRR